MNLQFKMNSKPTTRNTKCSWVVESPVVIPGDNLHKNQVKETCFGGFFLYFDVMASFIVTSSVCTL